MDGDRNEALARLTAENAKLRKINQALMARVERGIRMADAAFHSGHQGLIDLS